MYSHHLEEDPRLGVFQAFLEGDYRNNSSIRNLLSLAQIPHITLECHHLCGLLLLNNQVDGTYFVH